ncbi:MAG: outer membrane protein [Beijerinckiaceae bacterium]
MLKPVKRAGLVACAIFASSAALAADLPGPGPAPAPVPVAVVADWTGFYVGVNAGGVYAQHNASFRNASIVPLFVNAVLPGTLPQRYNLNKLGFIGGVQAGYNWQFGGAVVGIETDIAGSTASSTVRNNTGLLPPLFTINSTAQGSLRWLGTTRVRLGFLAWNNVLMYATGGVAYGGVNNRLTSQAAILGVPVANYAGGGSSTRFGWTAGAGFEYKVNYNWSVKTEYLYYNLGNRTVTAVDAGPIFPGQFVTRRFRNDGHIFRIGFNYKFGGPAGPVVAKY